MLLINYIAIESFKIINNLSKKEKNKRPLNYYTIIIKICRGREINTDLVIKITHLNKYRFTSVLVK